jgi:hypothetical protein
MRRYTKKRRQRGGSQSGKVYVFYHIYCMKNTIPIVKDQCMRIIFTGLYTRVDAIHCFLAGEEKVMKEIKDMLANFGKKFKVTREGPGDTSHERFTLEKIPDYVKPEDKFLYIHSKGLNHEDSSPVYWWRTYLEYCLIGRYKECLEKLNDHDVVGANFSTRIIGNHFSGNFWWSTGKYFMTLSKKIGTAHLDPEKYILTNSSAKHFDIDAGRVPENRILYSEKIYPKEYID